MPPPPEGAPIASGARHRVFWIAACLPFLGLLAWQISASWFLCDDAFITFRYARHLVAGHGAVFNRGEAVEGYTNFLWLLEIAGMWRLGVRPEVAAHLLSLGCTAGTLVLVVAMAARTDRPHRRCITWLAFCIVASNASFAVWSTGGLETRQFTFLVVLAAFLLGPIGAGQARLGLASLVLAAAEFTRPEGLLLFVVAVCWRLLQDRVAGRASRRRLLVLAVPFVVLVAGHYLWRHHYYGEWLPNTYYAKHVRAWYESGFHYLAAAGIELGAWLWLPLAGAATVWRLLAGRLDHALAFALIVPHALYLSHIGGDHFEYRPLDFYLPLLAPAIAEGVLLLAAGLRNALARPHSAAWQGRLAVALGLLALVHAHAIGITRLALDTARSDAECVSRPEFALDADRAGWLLRMPGMSMLCGMLEPLRDQLQRHRVAVSARHLQAFGRLQATGFAHYESLPAGVLPNDAVAEVGTVGILPFYLPELTVIDGMGLTDAVIARTETANDNRHRQMAHDRHAPPGYWRQRGVNIAVLSPAPSEADALRVAAFALRVEHGVWMPVQAVDREYLPRSVPPDRLRARHQVASANASDNRIRLDGRGYEGTRLLSTFEGPCELEWQCEGAAGVRSVPERVFGGVGPHVLSTTGEPDDHDRAGAARSSTFVAAGDESLVLFVAGEPGLGTALLLCSDAEVLHSFALHPADQLLPKVLSLAPYRGRSLHLEVHDAGAGWIALDQVFLAHESRRQDTDWESDLSAVWAPSPLVLPPDLLQVEPLRSEHGRAVSGAATVRFRNPMPCPVQLTLELIEGPLGARLAAGAWSPIAGGPAHPRVAPTATVETVFYLHVPQAVALTQQRFTVRYRLAAIADDGSASELGYLDLPVTWRDGD